MSNLLWERASRCLTCERRIAPMPTASAGLRRTWPRPVAARDAVAAMAERPCRKLQSAVQQGL